MKTMKLGEEIKRFSDKDALVKEKLGWNYITKKEWKEKVRDIFKQEKVEKTEEEPKKDKSDRSVKGKKAKTLKK